MAALRPLQTLARLLGSRASRGDRRIRFRIPTPLHGWREFAGEVGVIVLGVLIALGAQQAAMSGDRFAPLRRTSGEDRGIGKGQ